jgi:hypothetical protein
LKRWILTSQIEPGELEGTLSGRFGSSVMFVAYQRLLDQWYWIQPNGIEERIAEPEMLFLDSDWARDHPRKTPVSRRENPQRIRKGKAEQLRLF